MTPLPTNPGVILLGVDLCDPGEIPWGRGVSTAAPHPHGPCPDYAGAGWIAFPDPFIGGTLDARCPTCSTGAT